MKETEEYEYEREVLERKCMASNVITTRLCRVQDSGIPGAGKGLFAKTFVSKNEHVGNYCGKIVSRGDTRDVAIENARYVEDREYLMLVRQHMQPGFVVLDGKECNILVKYINSPLNTRKQPNVRCSEYGKIEAIRNINRGEELLIDYGPDYQIPIFIRRN